MNEWQKWKKQIDQGQNCMHVGHWQGLYPEDFETEETEYGPIPSPIDKSQNHNDQRYALAWACEPGRGAPLPYLMLHLGYPFKNWLIGSYQELYIGHAIEEKLRKSASSGGVLRAVIIELLESKKVEACLILKQGRPGQPEKAYPTFITRPEEILERTQSIYATTPLLSILHEAKKYSGDLAIVVLPEQAATLRMLQAAGHPDALKFKWVLGPYTGTNMYSGAVRNFLSANGVPKNQKVKDLQWRAGTWPGHLQITMEDGKTYKAEKFYYNYLIPFYISKHSLWVNDFANELTDISVGDAWSPKYEAARFGHSVVAARSSKAVALLKEMHSKQIIKLEEIPEDEALSMHGHMIDFKKRGSFIRNSLRKKKYQFVPDWGSEPLNIENKRIQIEKFIFFVFSLCGTRLLRKIVTLIPIGVIGPLFNFVRLKWKSASKPSKRKGLSNQSFRYTDMSERWHEIRSFSGLSHEEINAEVAEYNKLLKASHGK